MRGSPIPVAVLASHVIASVAPDLLKALKLPSKFTSLSFFTTDCDDVGYVSIDEATKKAQVEVLYASSFYAGANHSSGPLSGEFIGILGAHTPADAEAGLQAAVEHAENRANFYAIGDLKIPCFAHLVSRTGQYFFKEAKIAQGSSLAYLIAPPLEAMAGLDAALKAADVTMVRYFPAPSETNFSGGWLQGNQAACEAACDAFASKVEEIARCPLAGLGR